MERLAASDVSKGGRPARLLPGAELWYGPRGMRITRQVRYALYGVFDLAYNGEGRPISVQEIGARQQVPGRYLEQILQRLRRAGIVESKRGPGGGYALARPASQISVADILVALEGSVIEPEEGEAEVQERPAFVWPLLEEKVGDLLGSMSLAELCHVATQVGVARAEAEPPMYQI